VARNRQRAKERQARRKAQKGGRGDGDAEQRRQPDADELRREAVVAGSPDPADSPELTESELLRAGAPPEDVGSSAEVLEYEQDLDEGLEQEHFDPAEDVPEEDLVDGREPRRDAERHKDRPRFVQFLIAVWAELQRVQWPDRQALTTLTGVVLGFVLIAGGYLGLLDAIASRLIQAIL
jgi:preprotein translocase subunit SecE